MERVPIPKNPELFDRVISDIQKGLADNLPWLDHSFGRAERLVKSINGKKYYTPDVYAGGNDYILIAPDDKVLGNFSFFVIDDGRMWIGSQAGNLTIRLNFRLLYGWICVGLPMRLTIAIRKP